ncbi:MAG: carbohydrate ABC transporter substrate-binding protein, partial [Bosea sp. (in: a-proteobacteria)]
MKSVRHLVTGVALAAIATSWTGAAMAQESITVWFTKGFYKGEDDALLAVVDKFQKATGVKVDLSLYATEDCVTKSVGAV